MSLWAVQRNRSLGCEGQEGHLLSLRSSTLDRLHHQLCEHGHSWSTCSWQLELQALWYKQWKKCRFMYIFCVFTFSCSQCTLQVLYIVDGSWRCTQVCLLWVVHESTFLAVTPTSMDSKGAIAVAYGLLMPDMNNIIWTLQNFTAVHTWWIQKWIMYKNFTNLITSCYIHSKCDHVLHLCKTHTSADLPVARVTVRLSIHHGSSGMFS